MQLPNYTQVANAFIGHMATYSGAVVKVFLAISRRTIGWHKKSDKISYSQIAKMTGLSTNGLRAALETLRNDGWIVRTGEARRGYTYDLNIEALSDVSKTAISDSDTDLSQKVIEIQPELYQSVIPQKKEEKERKERLSQTPGYKDFVDLFFESYRVKTGGIVPPWGGKEGNLLKADIRRFEKKPDLLAALIGEFFSGMNEKVRDFVEVRKAGYSYGVFHSQIDALLVDHTQEPALPKPRQEPEITSEEKAEAARLMSELTNKLSGGKRNGEEEAESLAITE